jgi:hypothetical protein
MVRQKQKSRRIPFTNGRTNSFIDSHRSGWEEKTQEDKTKENIDEVEDFCQEIY